MESIDSIAAAGELPELVVDMFDKHVGKPVGMATRTWASKIINEARVLLSSYGSLPYHRCLLKNVYV